MAKTEKGDFDITYHHIDAPTNADPKLWEEKGIRRLINPKDGIVADMYRTEEINYLADLYWSAWRKLDGQNMRVMWDGEKALWNGKSNKYVCSNEIIDYMNSTFLEEIFEEKFGREKTVVLFGELVGKKVQTNELGLDKQEFVLFDVKINDSWLDKWQVQDIAEYFRIRTPADFGPIISAPLDDLIGKVASGELKDWEGIVATPMTQVRDKRGNRIIVKIKNKDYSK